MNMWWKDKLEWTGYILLGLVVTAAIFGAFILLEIETERILSGFYGG